MSSLQHAVPRAGLGADQAARSPADFVAVLDHLGLLHVGGEDAQSFLQGQLSCDVDSVSTRSSSYGAHCTPKGRMLANFLLWRDERGFYMALSRDLASAVQKQLSKFVLRSRVKVSDVSGSVVLAGASGALGERTVSGIFQGLPAKPHEARSSSGIGTAVRLKDGRLFLALTGPIDGRVELTDARVWRWLDIRAGLPLVTAATQDQFIPQMTNLELIGG